MRYLVLMLFGFGSFIGCANSSVLSKPPVTLNGLGSDLRVFMDKSCLDNNPVGSERTVGLDLAATLAVQIGTTFVKSFAQKMKEAGSPQLNSSVAISSGFFYPELSSRKLKEIRESREELTKTTTVAMNPDVRCIHITRDGFGRGLNEESLGEKWKTVGLTSAPSFYAQVVLQTGRDKSPFFKAELAELQVRKFEEKSTRHTSRDYVLFLDFELPEQARYFQIENGQGQFIELGGPFARGTISLNDIESGTTYLAKDLIGKETGWMQFPGAEYAEVGAPFNLIVTLVELKKGDPLAADIAAILSSASTQNASTAAFERLFENGARKKTRLTSEFESLGLQLRLVRGLEDANAQLVDSRSNGADRLAVRDAARSIQDAILAIKKHQEIIGWIGAFPEKLINDSELLISSQTP